MNKLTGQGAEIVTISEDWDIAKRIFARFATKEGARRPVNETARAHRTSIPWQLPAPDLGIANVTALAHLAACLRQFKPKRVLELGGGIGTITTLLLEHPAGVGSIVTTENNEFCLKALDKNLPREGRDRLRVVTELADLEAIGGNFDLAICDGGFDEESQFAGVNPGCRCFFEGGRALHRHLLEGYMVKQGWRYEPVKYPATGFVLKVDPQGWSLLGVALPTIRIRRRKGCWIGIVEKASTDGAVTEKKEDAKSL